MATVPLSGTNVRLLSNVPFSNDNKNTRWFDTLLQQESYFLNKPIVHQMVEANFQRIEGGGHYVAVNKSIDELWNTNYMMFRNEYYNKWFYGFVTKLEYKNTGLTYVHFEIDVLQTWRFNYDFKPSFVIREHTRLWNNDGSPVVNTLDEGLDYGTDYDIVDIEQYTPSLLFLVIVSTRPLHDTNDIRSSINGGPQPLCYYIHPFDVFGNTPNPIVGTETYFFPSTTELLNKIYSSTETVNNVVSLYITDHTGINYIHDQFNNTVIFNPSFYQELEFVVVDNPTPNMIYVKEAITYSTRQINLQEKYLPVGGIKSGGNWNFPNVKESKLLNYPYTVSFLEDFRGNRVMIRNEYIDGDQLIIDVMGGLSPSNKTAYIPRNYNNEKVLSLIDKTMTNLEHALIDNTPHDVPIVNSQLASFIQTNRNALQTKIDSIVFNGITNMMGSSFSGIVGGAIAGNPVMSGLGAVGGLVKGGGQALLEIQALESKIKDINNTPPQLAKMGDNSIFEYGNGYYGFWLVTKQIKPEYRKKLEDFFNMFGYKVNEVKIPNFHTRQNWNFVQTKNCNITGNINNNDLQEIKNIFDNGITLWHTDDVGNYSLSNGVIS